MSYTYPPYRLTYRKVSIYKQALQALEDTLRHKARASTDHQIHVDLAAVKVLKGIVPQHLPYDVVLAEHEWRIVSQALRTLSLSPDTTLRAQASALYQHWRRHKYAGFPHTIRKK